MAGSGFNAEVTFGGLVELELQEVVEFFRSQEEANAALAEVLRDEPDWRDLLTVKPIELIGLSWN